MNSISNSILNVSTRRVSSKSNVNCCVYGCNAVNKRNPELSFHRFPPPGQKVCYDQFGDKNLVDKRKVWELKLKMGKTVSPYMQVCSRHFTNDDYITPNEDCYAKRILKKAAIPSQNLPVTSSRKASDDNKRQKEERHSRFHKRRNIQDCVLKASKNGKETNTNNDELTEFAFNVSEEQAAEALVTLSNTNFNLSDTANFFVKRFSTVATQTNESCFQNLKCDSAVQVQTSWFSVSEYIKTDKAIKILTGIPSFALLNTLAVLHIAINKDIRVHKLSIKERIMLVFLKLKLDLSFVSLGVLFGDISAPTCKSVFEKTVLVLAEMLKNVIVFPSRDEIFKNTPICFKKYQNVRIILDCTEIFVQTPKKLCCRIKTYSHYKFMIGVTPAGLISFLSKPYGGRASDKNIFEQSNLLERLEPYVDQIMVDKGFLIDKACEEHGISFVRPPFLRKKKQFNTEEAIRNANIASARVHVERVNARIKIYKILKNTLPLHLVSLIHEIVIIICGITNMSNSIIADHLFLGDKV